MVDSISIAAASAQAAASADNTRSTTATSKLTEDFDTFLQLLIAQIQNQDPTSPLDTDAFTQQLVQFSELEQSIQSNTTLSDLLGTIESSNAANVVSYIGSTVTAEGAATTLKGGSASWQLNAAAGASNAQVTIRNDAGTPVFSDKVNLARGTNNFIWDGKTNAGGFAPEGTYSITVEAQSAEGTNINITSGISGVVDGVDLSGEQAVLLIGQSRVPLNAVTSVSSTPVTPLAPNQTAQAAAS